MLWRILTFFDLIKPVQNKCLLDLICRCIDSKKRYYDLLKIAPQKNCVNKNYVIERLIPPDFCLSNCRRD